MPNVKVTANYTQQEAINFIESHLKSGVYCDAREIVVFIDGAHPLIQAFTPSMSGPVPQEVLKLVIARDLIGAIKEYRALTGLGLRESKDFVEHVKYNILKQERNY